MKRRKVNRHVGFARMEGKGPGAKKSFTLLYGVSHVHGVRGMVLNADRSRRTIVVGIVSEQNKLLRNWGAYVDIVFWHVSRKMILVKEIWPIWKKPKDAQCWNRPMKSVQWTRGICFEDVDLPALVLGRWRDADEVEEGEEDPDSTRILTIRL